MVWGNGKGGGGHLAQGLDDSWAMRGAHVLGEAMQGHAEKCLQGAGPLLGYEVDLLAPQEGVLGGDERHGLLQSFCDHGSVALLLLHGAWLSGLVPRGRCCWRIGCGHTDLLIQMFQYRSHADLMIQIS